MEIKRTANAGVLLSFDNVSILLDGICGEVPPYSATPEHIKAEIYNRLPDVCAFTHTHTDHYDKDFSSFFEKKTGKKVISPENKCKIRVGDVEVESLDSRHIGKTDVEHISFIIKGSKTIWFMGDASPLTLKSMSEYPKPYILLVPFAYLNSASSLKLTKSVGARHIILLHLPEDRYDQNKIFENLEEFIINEQNIHTINLGATLNLD